MSNTIIILIILAAMIVAAPVAAQPGGMGQTFVFRKMDTNRDGKVDQTEYQAAMQERFSQTDANKDGLLTQEEVSARFEQLQELRRTRQQGGGMP